MPVTIKSANLKYRNSQGQYVGVNSVSDQETSAQLAAIAAAGTEKVAAVNSAGATQINAVQNKGDQVLNSIPDDFSEWTNEVESVKSAINSKLDAPETAGTSGQVLTSDGQGGQMWQTPSGGGDVTDVQVNGTSVLNQGVANVPVADANTFGVIKTKNNYGTLSIDGFISINPASVRDVKDQANWRQPISGSNAGDAAFYGLARAAGDTTQAAVWDITDRNYTETAKSKISDMLSAPVTVSGTTPSISAMAGVRYICGECATLDITVPASGIIDVVFESGSTATVLTVTPPTGMTMKWTNGFDPTSLDANTVYEINIMDGCYGVVGSWT